MGRLAELLSPGKLIFKLVLASAASLEVNGYYLVHGLIALALKVKSVLVSVTIFKSEK